jgi:hypothetical protein
MSKFSKFLTTCLCGRKTSKTYARAHGGKCKACVTGVEPAKSETSEQRNARMIDSGYQAYAREEGHYDLPDYA